MHDKCTQKLKITTVLWKTEQKFPLNKNNATSVHTAISSRFNCNTLIFNTVSLSRYRNS